jgi:hypothetical protein
MPRRSKPQITTPAGRVVSPVTNKIKYSENNTKGIAGASVYPFQDLKKRGDSFSVSLLDKDSSPAKCLSVATGVMSALKRLKKQKVVSENLVVKFKMMENEIRFFRMN